MFADQIAEQKLPIGFEHRYVQPYSKSGFTSCVISELPDVKLFRETAEKIEDPDNVKDTFITYSLASSDNKFTENGHHCLEVVIAGNSKDSGEELSVVAHSASAVFRDESQLRRWLQGQSMTDFLNSTDRESRGILVAGGIYNLALSPNGFTSNAFHYKLFLRQFVDKIQKKVQVNASILPAHITGGTNIYYATTDRRALVVQRGASSFYGEEPFCLDQLQEVAKDWDEKFNRYIMRDL